MDLTETTRHECNSDFLVVPNAEGFVVIKKAEIVFCEAKEYCTLFYLLNKKTITSTRHLKHYERLLQPGKFMRVHHSYMVNLSHVLAFNHPGIIFLSEDYVCALGNTYKSQFLEVFGRMR